MKKPDGLKLAVLLISLTVSLFTGCGKDSPTESDSKTSSGPVAMTWTRVEHYYGSWNNILTITELLGPKGARVDNIIPGKYIARGTYDLRGTSITSGDIELGFLGSVTIGDGTLTAEKKTVTVPEGQLTGTYEVIQEIFRLTSGPGNPLVDFYDGSTMEDRITLY
ncbi:hypothetical protein JW948_01565 [bacterium]|nr:hypothetical protein [bacterium]